jgi:hypothetical protein
MSYKRSLCDGFTLTATIAPKNDLVLVRCRNRKHRVEGLDRGGGSSYDYLVERGGGEESKENQPLFLSLSQFHQKTFLFIF